ncbi:methylenetetrahydrofolate reductase [uncultured Demequina sp.]|uniref:methylenetetrahydrofolate reductase n=1 Tax=uncultured Demequina sp. TaxID=693499 RepID=UPI0025D5143F|nr:methylenetetrahydrofolate reductase [uncultured Demequina sp.]
MPGPDSVLSGASLEITAADGPGFSAAAGALAPGTRVAITHLGTQTAQQHLDAARAVAAAGHIPVAHLAARRLASAAELEATLAAHAQHGTDGRVVVVGGDPRQPLGPFSEAAQLIETGMLASHGVTDVGIAGYPDGHPTIADEVLWAALTRKLAAIADHGMQARIVTQFCFDVDLVLAWIERVRDAGIDAPLQVGVPGPANVRRLVGFARRCGVQSSAALARKYGFSVSALVANAGPDRFIDGLREGLDPAVHGDVHLHLFALGGVGAAVEWLARQHAAA